MRPSRWTLLVVGEDGPAAKRFSLPEFVVRRAAMGAGIGALLLLGTLGAAVHQAVLGHRAAQLEAERTQLLAEVDRMTDRVQGMESALARYADDGDALRLAAGLEPLDEEVLLVGVGGPESPSMRDDLLEGAPPEIGDAVFAVSYDLNVLERRTRLISESLEDAADSVRTHHDRYRATPSITPTIGWVSSSFGPSRIHPVHNRPMPHMGIDIAAPEGTPIQASADGRVTRAGMWAGYGLTVEIEHGHGYSTLYAHASEVEVEVGDQVRRGEVIARVGSTGLATGPHLHFEVQREGEPRDPSPYFVAGAIP